MIIASLDRHLKNKGYSLSIVRDREFSSSKQVLDGKAKQLRLAGRGKIDCRFLPNFYSNTINYGFGPNSQNKEALTVLCSVVKHLGSGWNTQEVGRNTRLRLVFPLTLLSCPSRFITEQSTVETSLFIK